jgi:hypothetical protein
MLKNEIGLDAKVLFRHDVPTGVYSLVLRFPRNEFIIDCCVHLFEDFKKQYPLIPLLKVIPESYSPVDNIINKSFDTSDDDLPF